MLWLRVIRLLLRILLRVMLLWLLWLLWVVSVRRRLGLSGDLWLCRCVLLLVLLLLTLASCRRCCCLLGIVLLPLFMPLRLLFLCRKRWASLCLLLLLAAA